MTAPAVVKRAFADGSLELELDGRAGCAGCHGICMWRLMPNVQRQRFAAGPGIAPGASVLVRLPERYVLLTALVLYGVPLASLLGGGLLGFAVAGTDLGSLLGALGGLAASLALTPGWRQWLEAAMARHLVIEPRR